LIYLLDTNAVIALVNGSSEIVRLNALRAEATGDHITLSSVSMHEMWYGVARSGRSRENAERLRDFLKGGLQIFPFDENDAEIAGEIRGELAKAGTPIGPYDLLIAAQALRRNAVLVTANEREFTRVRGPRTKNWAKP
jgi:tRNA(fMet)-specific endonuclease VapC